MKAELEIEIKDIEKNFMNAHVAGLVLRSIALTGKEQNAKNSILCLRDDYLNEAIEKSRKSEKMIDKMKRLIDKMKLEMMEMEIEKEKELRELKYNFAKNGG